MNSLRATWFVLIALTLVLFSCKPRATNVEEVRKAIQDAGDRQVSAFNAKDLATCVSFYAPDGAIMPQNGPAATSREQMETMFKQYFQVSHDLKVTTKKVDASGDLAYRTGEYTLVVEPPGMPAMTDSGKYVDVWKRQPDGKWLIVADIFNTNLAPPPPPTPAATKSKK